VRAHHECDECLVEDLSPGARLAAVTAGPSDSAEKAFEFFNNLAFLIRGGRAVVYPVYQGTRERRGCRRVRLPEPARRGRIELRSPREDAGADAARPV
jgi:hypothetical protein